MNEAQHPMPLPDRLCLKPRSPHSLPCSSMTLAFDSMTSSGPMSRNTELIKF